MNTLHVAAATGSNLDSLKLNGAVSAAVGLVCLAAAGLIWFIGNKHTPRLVVLLVMTGMAGMVGTPFGRWVRSVVDWANEALANVTTRWTGTAVTGLLAAGATYFVAVRLKDNKIDEATLVVAGIVPLAVATIPGSIGHGALTVVTALTSVVAWGVGQLFSLA